MRYFFIIYILLIASIGPVASESVKAKYSPNYVILDLAMMNERYYDSNRDRTAIGYISPEIFKDLKVTKRLY